MRKSDAVAVIGAGPAGTATVGSLLEKGYTNITWIDPYFRGGDFRTYWGIPANTKSAHLSFFANFLSVFSNHSDKPECSADVFQHYEPDEIANLDELRLCLIRMAAICRKHYSTEVKMVVDTVEEVIETTSSLELRLRKNPTVNTFVLFVCIGAVPKNAGFLPSVPRLDLFHMMSPFAVEKYDLTNQVVDVFGSRNSALLVLKNLMAMRKPPKLVRHYLNKELVYAEYIDDFIRHNFSGLKGAAKEFGQLYEKGEYKGRIVTIQYDPAKITPGATKVVEAVGFVPNTINFVDRSGRKGYDLVDCHMRRKDGSVVPSIHFVGFVNPQIITDRQGQTMPAVGVTVFMQHTLAILNQLQLPSKL